MDFWRFSLTDVDLSARLVGTYDPLLIALSFVVASVAAYSALSVTERMRAAPHARTRLLWLSAGSLSMGLGVWAMHFIGMMSFRLAVPMNYGLTTTVLSVIPAVIASGVTIQILSVGPTNAWRLHVGALLMAAGIGTMHYTGMESMRMHVDIRYDFALFVASILVAYLLAALAFWVADRLRRRNVKDAFAQIWGGGALGVAVCGMHYTAMRASLFFPHPSPEGAREMMVSPFAISALIVVATSFIVAVVVGSTWVDRKLQLARETVERLEGLLPICARCKQIRDADGSWIQVEVYVRDHSAAEFSHSICPPCSDELYPEFVNTSAANPSTT